MNENIQQKAFDSSIDFEIKTSVPLKFWKKKSKKWSLKKKFLKKFKGE